MNFSTTKVGQRGFLLNFKNLCADIPEEEWRGSFEDSPPPVEDQHRDDGKLTKVNEVKIEALSKELTALSKRFTELTTEHKQLQRKAIGYHNQSATNEKLIKELRSRESDLLVRRLLLLSFFVVNLHLSGDNQRQRFTNRCPQSAIGGSEF